MLFLIAAALANPSWSDIESNDAWEPLTTRSHDEAGDVAVLRSTIHDVQCFAATAQTDVDKDALIDVVTDVAAAKDWSSAGVSHAELLSHSGNTYEYFQYLDVPGWTLASDRFWFLAGTLEQDGEATVFRWDKLDKGGAHSKRHTEVTTENPGAVEPPINTGGWRFEPAGELVKIAYYICTDAGGSIPRMVQNTATRSTLPDTVGDVVREARKRLGR